LVGRAWVFGTVYLGAGRLLVGWAHRRARVTRLAAKPTLIVGAGEVGARVERRLLAQPDLGLHPVGYLDADPLPHDQVPGRVSPVMGPPADVAKVARETGAEHVVLGFSSTPDRLLIPLVRECEELGLKVSLVPRLFESVNVHVSLEHLGGLPLLGLHTVDPKGWHFVVKDVVDRVAAAVALLLLAAARRLGARGAVVLPGPDPVPPAAHRSRRARLRAAQVPFYAAGGGRRGPPKLVALGPDVAPGGVEGADRRTAVGRLMRRTSMGRLPQLLNVAAAR
jgi:CoA-binding domain